MISVIDRLLSSSAVQSGVGQSEANHSGVAMLTLASKLKREDGGKTGRASGASDSTHRVSIRDRLLTKGTWATVLLPSVFFCPAELVIEAKQSGTVSARLQLVSCPQYRYILH